MAKIRLRINLTGNFHIGDEHIRLLKTVGRCGSISSGATCSEDSASRSTPFGGRLAHAFREAKTSSREMLRPRPNGWDST
jgi:hypothetical protein